MIDIASNDISGKMKLSRQEFERLVRDVSSRIRKEIQDAYRLPAVLDNILFDYLGPLTENTWSIKYNSRALDFSREAREVIVALRIITIHRASSNQFVDLTVIIVKNGQPKPSSGTYIQLGGHEQRANYKFHDQWYECSVTVISKLLPCPSEHFVEKRQTGYFDEEKMHNYLIGGHHGDDDDEKAEQKEFVIGPHQVKFHHGDARICPFRRIEFLDISE